MLREYSLFAERLFGKIHSRGESACVVFSLENGSTLLGIVEFQGEAMPKGFWREVCGRASADFFFAAE